jgi:hypothetical protein
VGRVADDPDAVGREVVAPVVPGPPQRVGPELVADLAVVGEGADREVVPEPVVAELRLGAAAQVAGEKPLHDAGALRGLAEELRFTPGQHLAAALLRMPGRRPM